MSNNSLKKILNLEIQREIFQRKPVRTAVLLIGCLFILIWQISFYADREKLDDNYRISNSGGIQSQGRFVYFYYYLGLFPVATTVKNPEFSKEAAQKILTRQPDSLRTEWGESIRFGDFGRMFLFLPSALLNGSPENLSVKTVNIPLFIFALVAVFIAFWMIGQPILGIITIILLGSSPFQLYEVYAHENIFSWPISSALLILALHFPLLSDRKPSKYYLWTIPVLTGILLATIRQVRSEPVTIIVSVVALYLLLSKTEMRVKGGMILLLVLSFLIFGRLWRSYFDGKLKEAYQVVKSVGGEPFEGPFDHSHQVWHPIWAGLSDWSKKYAYTWSDSVAAMYAIPILEKKYHFKFPGPNSKKWIETKTPGYHSEYYEDLNNKKYHKSVLELDEYNIIARDKIIHDIINDPFWFIEIILHRVWRVFAQTSPVRIGLGRWGITFPMYGMHGVLFFTVLGILVFTRNWMLFKLLCFTLPLGATSILVYSGGGTTYYSCYQFFAAALCFAWMIEGFLWRFQTRIIRAKRNFLFNE